MSNRFANAGNLPHLRFSNPTRIACFPTVRDEPQNAHFLLDLVRRQLLYTKSAPIASMSQPFKCMRTPSCQCRSSRLRVRRSTQPVERTQGRRVCCSLL